MKRSKLPMILLVILATLTTGAAWARTRVGVYIGVPIAGAYYPGPYYHRHYYPYYAYPYGYPYPYYSYPAPVVVAPAAPPVYVEQADQQQQAAAQPQYNPPNYWYYCNNPQGYYPSVQQCPSGWQKILPQPAQR